MINENSMSYHDLDIYITYNRLTATSLGNFLSSIGSIANTSSRMYRDLFQPGLVDIPTLEITGHPVSRAYFEGVLSTPGRSVPWIKDSFNYQISGGLEPNEESTWRLAPNMFGEWGKAPKDRKDMVLTVTVTRIDGADEKAIFNSEFSKWDKERLEALTSRIDKLKSNLAKLKQELI